MSGVEKSFPLAFFGRPPPFGAIERSRKRRKIHMRGAHGRSTNESDRAYDISRLPVFPFFSIRLVIAANRFLQETDVTNHYGPTNSSSFIVNL